MVLTPLHVIGQIFAGPACDRVYLAYVGSHNKDHTILRKSRIEHGNCEWDEKERHWIRSSILLLPPTCVMYSAVTLEWHTAVAWRDYVGDDALQSLPERDSADGTFNLSPLWVYVFTHVSSSPCHFSNFMHTLNILQVFCEIVPFKWYLTFKDKDLDATAIEAIFDLEIAPGLDLITPNLLAYFDYMIWWITQPTGTKSGPEEEMV